MKTHYIITNEKNFKITCIKRKIIISTCILLFSLTVFSQEPVTLYYKSGYIKASGNYDRNGKKTGLWKEYEYNKISRIGYYKNDKKTGKWIYYEDYKKNIIAETGYYKNGKKNGEFIKYHNNGKIAEKGYYIDDKPEGTFIKYYYDGTVKSIKKYENGKKTGDWIFYDSGIIEKIEQYNNNELIREIEIIK